MSMLVIVSICQRNVVKIKYVGICKVYIWIFFYHCYVISSLKTLQWFCSFVSQSKSQNSYNDCYTTWLPSPLCPPLLLLFAWFTQLQSRWPPSWSSNMPDTPLPQGLVTGCSLCPGLHCKLPHLFQVLILMSSGSKLPLNPWYFLFYFVLFLNSTYYLLTY